METVKKGKRTDVGFKKPPADKRFSKTNQPDNKAKAEGQRKAYFERKVIKEMLSMPYKFAPESQIRKQLLDNFGPEILKMSVGEVMTLQQMQRAILKGDSYAYNAVLDQGLGKQTQKVATVDPETGKPTKQVFVIGGQTIEF